MKNTFTFLFFCLLFNGLHAQIKFQKTYGGTGVEGNCFVATTSDGGYALAGSSGSTGAGEYDVYVVRTDSMGTVLWAKTYGGTLNDIANDIKQTSDEGFIITGSTESFNGSTGHPALYLVRTDKNGDTLWTRTYNGSFGETGYSVQQTADSGFVVVGNWGNTGYLYTIRTKSNGDTLWTTINDGGYGTGVVVNDDKGFTSCGTGYVYDNSEGNEMFLCRTDSNGAVIWYKTYGGNNAEGGFGLAKGNDGGFITIGFTSTFSNIPGVSDYYVVKTDSAGNVQWSKGYRGPASNSGSAIEATGDGYLLYGNEIYNNDQTYTSLLIKTDNTGNVLWAREYASILPGNVKQTHDGGFVVTGYPGTIVNPQASDFYLIKTDANGVSGCSDSAVTIMVDTAATVQNGRALVSQIGTIVGTTATVVTDGSTTSNPICLTTGIESITISALQISVFPNPALDEATITTGNDFGQIKTVSIYNMLGQPVLINTSATDHIIKIASLPAGSYFIKVANVNGLTGTAKLEKL